MMPTQVAMLIGPRQPSAVAWLVVAEWVNAVNGEVRRAWSHVSVELRKALAPSVAHGHTARSVEAVIAGRWRQAARLHRTPNGVFAAMVGTGDGGSVLRIASRAHGLLVATARLRVAARQVFAHLHGGLSAIAAAAPEGAGVVLGFAVKDEQLTEALARQVVHGGKRHTLILPRSVPFVEHGRFKSGPMRDAGMARAWSARAGLISPTASILRRRAA